MSAISEIKTFNGGDDVICTCVNIYYSKRVNSTLIVCSILPNYYIPKNNVSNFAENNVIIVYLLLLHILPPTHKWKLFRSCSLVESTNCKNYRTLQPYQEAGWLPGWLTDWLDDRVIAYLVMTKFSTRVRTNSPAGERRTQYSLDIAHQRIARSRSTKHRLRLKVTNNYRFYSQFRPDQFNCDSQSLCCFSVLT